MKTIIIEDEPFVAKDLQKLIAEVAPDIEIVTVLASLKQAREWFAAHTETPDLLFMDIQLSDGVSFDLFDTVHPDCPIIFTTAYNEYALRAFKLNSIDYLLKPVDKTDLEAAIAKFKRYHSANTELGFRQRVESLMHMMQSTDRTKKYKERFLVNTRNAIMPLAQDQIACFVKNELVYAHTFDQQRYVADYDTLDELEQLADPSRFFRANRQTILHINSIEKYAPGVNGKLLVKLKCPVPEIEISREKAHHFKEWIDG